MLATLIPVWLAHTSSHFYQTPKDRLDKFNLPWTGEYRTRVGFYINQKVSLTQRLRCPRFLRTLHQSGRQLQIDGFYVRGRTTATASKFCNIEFVCWILQNQKWQCRAWMGKASITSAVLHVSQRAPKWQLVYAMCIYAHRVYHIMYYRLVTSFCSL